MMLSQIACRGLRVRSAVDCTMTENHQEMNAHPLVNTHLSTALEQHWEGRVS